MNRTEQTFSHIFHKSLIRLVELNHHRSRLSHATFSSEFRRALKNCMVSLFNSVAPSPCTQRQLALLHTPTFENGALGAGMSPQVYSEVCTHTHIHTYTSLESVRLNTRPAHTITQTHCVDAIDTYFASCAEQPGAALCTRWVHSVVLRLTRPLTPAPRRTQDSMGSRWRRSCREVGPCGRWLPSRG